MERSLVEKKFSVKRRIKVRVILKLEKIESGRIKFEVFRKEGLNGTEIF